MSTVANTLTDGDTVTLNYDTMVDFGALQTRLGSKMGLRNNREMPSPKDGLSQRAARVHARDALLPEVAGPMTRSVPSSCIMAGQPTGHRRVAKWSRFDIRYPPTAIS
jgi:hypothetical protein